MKLTYLQPLFPAIVCALLFFCAREWKRRERKPRALTAFVVLVFLVSWMPSAFLASKSLEVWYEPVPPRAQDAQGVGAIVVLSGSVQHAVESRPYWSLGFSTAVRCRYALYLHRRFPDLPILACGGVSNPRSSASVMRDYLMNAGVSSGEIWLEERSTSTHENALEAAGILRQRGVERIFLVTQAYHMLRSELCFRRQGIEVVPVPCDFRAAGFDFRMASFLPRARAIEEHENALHEWVGLLWYWIRDRI